MSWLSDLLHWLFPPRPPAPPPSPTGDRRADLHAAINAQRTAPLRRDNRLDLAAQEWAESMASDGILSHGNVAVRFDFVGYRPTALAENVAEGQATATEVVAGWMGSPGHRANLLGDYRDVGLGAAVDARGRVWWVADMGSEAP